MTEYSYGDACKKPSVNLEMLQNGTCDGILHHCFQGKYEYNNGITYDDMRFTCRKGVNLRLVDIGSKDPSLSPITDHT